MSVDDNDDFHNYDNKHGGDGDDENEDVSGQRREAVRVLKKVCSPIILAVTLC